MNADGVFPYFTPGVGAVGFDSWRLLADEWQELPDELHAWDPDLNIRISQTVSIDVDRVLSECGLPRGTPLRLTASWTSSASGMRARIASVDVGTSGQVVLDGILDGQQVAGALEIQTTLSLPAPVPAQRPVIPSSSGAILARSVTYLEVEAGGTFFPTAVVDFAATRMDSLASWRLETTADLSAPFLGSYLLLINKRDAELVKAIESRNANPRQLALISELEGQLAILMFELALLNKDALLERLDWSPESIGGVLWSFLGDATDYGLEGLVDHSSDRATYVARLAGSARSRMHGRQFE